MGLEVSEGWAGASESLGVALSGVALSLACELWLPLVQSFACDAMSTVVASSMGHQCHPMQD